MNQLVKIAGFSLSSLLFFGCFNPDTYDTSPASVDKITFISANVDGIAADGVSTGSVVVKISDKASPGRRTVVFKTSSGFFVGGKGDSITVPANENFIASAKLANLNTTTAIVTAKILKVEAPDSRSVAFVKAFPFSISVTVDSFSVAGNYKGETVLTASLRTQNGGKPSIGHEVQFAVTRPSNATTVSIGDFLNDKSTATTDADGKAKIRYTPGVTNPGYATVTASTTIAAPGSSTAPGSNTTTTTRIYIR